MKTIWITDDRALHGIGAVKMRCDCGWVDKAWLRDSRPRAEHHMRTRHTKGRLVYGNTVVDV